MATALAFVVWASPSIARAQAAPTERAETLYTDAKRLASEGRFAEACPMFEESQRLEPAIGTQFNLADCYEKTGRPATALSLFREVSRIGQMTGNQERKKTADGRISTLERAVPRIRIAKLAQPIPKDVDARIDGKIVARDDLVKGLAVDPGQHTIELSAAGHRPWTSTVTASTTAAASGDGATLDVDAPPLEPIAATVILTPSEERPPSKWRPVSFVMMGLGAVGLVTGTIFGVSAISKKNDAGCDGTNCSGSAVPDAEEKLGEAQSAGTASTVFFVAGGLLAAGGVVLYFMAPRGGPRASAQATPTGVGLRLEQSF